MRGTFVELKVSHASGKGRHRGLGVKMLFEGLKQLSRVRDEVVRKLPGQGPKGTGKPRMYPKGRKGFKWLWISTMASCGEEIGRNTWAVELFRFEMVAWSGVGTKGMLRSRWN